MSEASRACKPEGSATELAPRGKIEVEDSPEAGTT